MIAIVATPMPPRPRPPLATLLSDEPTLELLVRAQDGDRGAVEALLERCIPSLKRWAHGRLPPAARDSLDTGDLVQETVLHVLRRLDHFQPRHVGAMQAYLRQSVINRIRDEVRRVNRQPQRAELPDEVMDSHVSALQAVITAESYERYRTALAGLTTRERELVVAHLESHWGPTEIATRFGMSSPDAARMAVKRALKRLTAQLRLPG
jgi:RNA polymerase sigma-70 factor (ECF subfamily)